MDFFASQEAARNNTKRLVIYLLLSVLCLIFFVNLVVFAALNYLATGEIASVLSNAERIDWNLVMLVSGAVFIVILGGSVFKWRALAAGGKVIAESLGGRVVTRDTNDTQELVLLNVVEEMAIASGSPVPLVYLLDQELGINAFAAGLSTGDAVIGVTQGCIAQLNRDELQGVVAHEFGHILNGDMRLNLRLIAILHGTLLIGAFGYFLFRSSMFSPSGSKQGKKKNNALIGVGIGLMVVGYCGTFFGNIIKASMSRQREFLADASAVQFTRNNLGIANALKKIGGFSAGSLLQAPKASEMSHGYFNSGVKFTFKSLFATHPPLEARIKKLQPMWGGKFAADLEPKSNFSINKSGSTVGGQSLTNVDTINSKAKPMLTSLVLANQLLGSIGQVGGTQLQHANTMLTKIPKNILSAIHEPYGARAVIYCLVIEDLNETIHKQLELMADDGIAELVASLHSSVKCLDHQLRLPIIDIALSALRQLSSPQYVVFKQNVNFLIELDNKITIFEWSVLKIVFHHLSNEYETSKNIRPRKYLSSQTLQRPIQAVLSVLSHNCVQDKSALAAGFNKGVQLLEITGLHLLSEQQSSLQDLSEALDELAHLKPLEKPALLRACLSIITQDQYFSVAEMELMRGIGAMLDCPIPMYIEPST